VADRQQVEARVTSWRCRRGRRTAGASSRAPPRRRPRRPRASAGAGPSGGSRSRWRRRRRDRCRCRPSRAAGACRPRRRGGGPPPPPPAPPPRPPPPGGWPSSAEPTLAMPTGWPSRSASSRVERCIRTRQNSSPSAASSSWEATNASGDSCNATRRTERYCSQSSTPRGRTVMSLMAVTLPRALLATATRVGELHAPTGRSSASVSSVTVGSHGICPTTPVGRNPIRA
jgi:hypothetical protein